MSRLISSHRTNRSLKVLRPGSAGHTPVKLEDKGRPDLYILGADIWNNLPSILLPTAVNLVLKIDLFREAFTNTWIAMCCFVRLTWAVKVYVLYWIHFALESGFIAHFTYYSCSVYILKMYLVGLVCSNSSQKVLGSNLNVRSRHIWSLEQDA